MSRASDDLPREILRLLADSASRGDEAGLTRPQIARSLGYSEGTVSQALNFLASREKVSFERSHVSGQKYRVLRYRPTPSGLIQGSQDPPLAPFSMPEPAAPFVGRTQELSRLNRAYRGGGVVVVEGVSGMGKTALVRRSLRHAWTRLRPVWTTLSPAVEAEDIVTTLRRASHDRRTAGSRTPALRGATPSNPALWVVDDLDRATPGALQIVQGAMFAPESNNLHATVLITSQGVPFPIQGGPSLHLTLTGLPRREALLLAREVGLPEERFEDSYRETLGSPRYLRQSTLPGVQQGAGFAKAAMASFAPEMKTALLPFALAWHGVPVSLALKLGLDQPTLDRLCSLSILEGPATGLRLVDPLSDRLVETTPWEEVREAHASLAYSVGSVDRPERFYHLVHAGRADEAIRLLKEDEKSITGKGHSHVYQAGLRLATLVPPGSDRGSVWLAVAEMQRAWGDPVMAATFLSNALENLPRDDPQAVLATGRLVYAALRTGSLGQVESWSRWLRRTHDTGAWSSVRWFTKAAGAVGKGDWGSAALHFSRAERFAISEGQAEIQLLAAHWLMEAQRRLGKMVQAEATFQRALPLAESVGTPDSLRRVRLSGALLLTKTGDIDKAKAVYVELLDEAHEAGAKSVEAIAWLGLAYVSKIQGDRAAAISATKKAIVLSESISDWMTASRGYAGLSNLTRENGDAKEARILAARAKSLAQEFGPALSLPWALEAEALIESDARRLDASSYALPSKIRLGPDWTPSHVM